MSVEKIQAIRGMSDMLPQDTPYWEKFSSAAEQVAKEYGYVQIRTPILEQTKLFKRGIGEVTDIVEKEMYSFVDSLNGDELSMRPENTASVVRACIEHNLLYNGPRRLWYMGPMFRHERPQKGRFRQFHQFGIEALGFNGPDVDAEQLFLIKRLWDELGIKGVKLELNCLGQIEERKAYRDELIKYFEANRDVLDEDAQRRLYTNPLRILDTKNPTMQGLVENAPKLINSLGDTSKAFLEQLESILTSGGITYSFNPRLVRGLDYYNLTVYEWVTGQAEGQTAVCGGGRYDPLIEMLGGKPTPACGFAMGIERILDLMKEEGINPAYKEACVYVAWSGEQSFTYAFKLSELLRDQSVGTILHAGGGKFAAQLKKANASGADYAVIIGESEVEGQTVTIKPLRENLSDYGQQLQLPLNKAVDYLKEKNNI